VFEIKCLGPSERPTVASVQLKKRESRLLLRRKLRIVNPGDPLLG
jgi:hypothetical protein